MDDVLRLAKRTFVSDPTVENYRNVQRMQLRQRTEPPWPCGGGMCQQAYGLHECPRRFEGSICLAGPTRGHDMVDVPLGDPLYAECGLPTIIGSSRSYVLLRVCTHCGGTHRVKMVQRNWTGDPLFPRTLP